MEAIFVECALRRAQSILIATYHSQTLVMLLLVQTEAVSLRKRIRTLRRSRDGPSPGSGKNYMCSTEFEWDAMLGVTHVTHVTQVTHVTHVTHVTYMQRMGGVTHVTHASQIEPNR